MVQKTLCSSTRRGEEETETREHRDSRTGFISTLFNTASGSVSPFISPLFSCVDSFHRELEFWKMSEETEKGLIRSASPCQDRAPSSGVRCRDHHIPQNSRYGSEENTTSQAEPTSRQFITLCPPLHPAAAAAASFCIIKTQTRGKCFGGNNWC